MSISSRLVLERSSLAGAASRMLAWIDHWKQVGKDSESIIVIPNVAPRDRFHLSWVPDSSYVPLGMAWIEFGLSYVDEQLILTLRARNNVGPVGPEAVTCIDVVYLVGMAQVFDSNIITRINNLVVSLTQLPEGTVVGAPACEGTTPVFDLGGRKLADVPFISLL